MLIYCISLPGIAKPFSYIERERNQFGCSESFKHEPMFTLINVLLPPGLQVQAAEQQNLGDMCFVTLSMYRKYVAEN